MGSHMTSHMTSQYDEQTSIGTGCRIIVKVMVQSICSDADIFLMKLIHQYPKLSHQPMSSTFRPAATPRIAAAYGATRVSSVTNAWWSKHTLGAQLRRLQAIFMFYNVLYMLQCLIMCDSCLYNKWKCVPYAPDSVSVVSSRISSSHFGFIIISVHPRCSYMFHEFHEFHEFSSNMSKSMCHFVLVQLCSFCVPVDPVDRIGYPRHSALAPQRAIEALAGRGLQRKAPAVRRQTPQARPFGPQLLIFLRLAKFGTFSKLQSKERDK